MMFTTFTTARAVASAMVRREFVGATGAAYLWRA